MTTFADLPYEIRAQIFSEYYLILFERDPDIRFDLVSLLKVSPQIYREAADAARRIIPSLLKEARLALPRAKYNARYYHSIAAEDWEKTGSKVEKPDCPRKTYFEVLEEKWTLEDRIKCFERADRNLLGPEMRLFNGCPEAASDELRWLFGESED